jgi:hypothetical protein
MKSIQKRRTLEQRSTSSSLQDEPDTENGRILIIVEFDIEMSIEKISHNDELLFVI